MTSPPLLSAHRGGAGADSTRENTLEALRDAVALDCEYVEFDVQRCRGGVHVLHHDDHVLSGVDRVPIASLTAEEFQTCARSYVVLDDALAILRGRKKLHLDLKFLPDPDDGEHVGREVALVRHVVEVMGVANVIVTTAEDDCVRAVRAWSRERHPDLLVGLSLGQGAAGLGIRRAVRMRISELFPGRRLKECDANLVVCHKTLARVRVAGWAQRHGLPLVVWTVDRPRELRAALRSRRAWLITTNFPCLAVRLRRELYG